MTFDVRAFYRRLGQRIAQVRLGRGKSLASISKIYQDGDRPTSRGNTQANYESAERRISLFRLAQLSAVLGMELAEWFLDDAEWKKLMIAKGISVTPPKQKRSVIDRITAVLVEHPGRGYSVNALAQAMGTGASVISPFMPKVLMRQGVTRRLKHPSQRHNRRWNPWLYLYVQTDTVREEEEDEQSSGGAVVSSREPGDRGSAGERRSQ